MPTVCVRFRLGKNGKVAALTEAYAAIQQEAIDVTWENKKTATLTIITVLYPSLTARYPHIHTTWLQSALRSEATIVHPFKNRKRKVKTKLEQLLSKEG